MRWLSSRNEENMIEAEQVSCLLCNSQVAIVNGIEAPSQYTETCGTEGLTGC